MTTLGNLAAMSKPDYINEVRARVGDDDGWVILLHPALVERTRWALGRLIDNLDRQKARGGDPDWLKRLAVLRKHVYHRLDRLPPAVQPIMEYTPSSTKESQKWRAFSAALARVLAGYDQEALERIQAPYGGLSALKWLEAREEKL